MCIECACRLYSLSFLFFSFFFFAGAKTSGYPETDDVEEIEGRCGKEVGTKRRNHY